jgi:hypothetical protein
MKAFFNTAARGLAGIIAPTPVFASTCAVSTAAYARGCAVDLSRGPGA